MRLTKDQKSIITKIAVEKTFERRHAALRKENNELAMLVYDALYPPEIQHQMSKLPDEFFGQTTVVYVQLTDSTMSKDLIELILVSSKKISARDRDWQRPLWNANKVQNTIVSRIRKLQSKLEKIALDTDNLRQKIQQLLAGINTIKALQEEWPEGSPYYSNLAPKPELKNVPAVRGKDISEMILEMETDN